MRSRFLNHSTADLVWIALISFVISVLLASVAVNALMGY